MAEVFLAAWEVAPRVRRPVVIKRLYEHFGDDPIVSQMFMDEARLVCRLEHECIVKTHEVGVIDGQCCIAMEYLAGQPLRRLIHRTWKSGGLPIDLAVYIAIRVLEALEYAHDARDPQGRPLEIVHRDISPHNIFVTNNGLVKVLDFGIAKAKSHEGHTAAGLIKGKFAYLAPEQANNQTVDRKADIWSLGVVLWEMLSGTRLFKADNEAATLRATLEADIPIVSALRAEVNPELDRILWRSLQRDRNLRYPNASTMKEELLSYLSTAHRVPDKSALATLMREQFHDEIVDQRRMVYELMESGASASAAGDEMASITDLTPSGSEHALSSQMSRISSLVQELTARHRTVLHTLFVALFVFVAVAAFFICIFLVRFNRQITLSMQHNSGALPIVVSSATAPSAGSAVSIAPPSSAAPLSTASVESSTAEPSVSAVPALSDALPLPPTNARTEPKTWAPRTPRKPAKSKVDKPLLNYGI